MTKYVISGYIGFDNFGDEAIAKVLTSHLKNINAEKITVLSSNPEKTSKVYNVDSVNFLNFYKPISESDVLISGGGSLLQDITSLKSLIYYLAVIVYALVLNKKVIIFAQGFSQFRTKIGKFLTKFVLSYCDKIYVRDLKSQEILKKMGLSSKLISDPVFSIKTNKRYKKEGLGIQLRDFPTLTDEFLELLANEVAKNFKDAKFKLFSLQDSQDLPVLEKFSKLLNSKGILTLIYKNLSIDSAIEELSKIEYLIGMRFHANLVAAKAGVKILGINYDSKVYNLSQKIGFPIIDLNQKSITDKIKDMKNLKPSKYQIPTFDFPEI